MTTLAPADMSLDELDAAMRRLVKERQTAGPKRREIILKVADVVLDEVLARRLVDHG